MLKSVLAVGLLVGILAARAWSADDDVYAQWERAFALREDRRYDEAVAVIEAIGGANGVQPEVAKRACNEIVFTRIQDGRPGLAEQAARQALARFPDLEANTIYVPQAVNDLYARLRVEMYGSITIRRPQGASVTLDGIPAGTVPVHLPYVPVGRHALRVSRNRHLDHVENLEVEPGGRHNLEVSLARRRDRSWWLYRIGGGVAVVGMSVLLASGGGGIDTPAPLPGAPAPPSE